MIICFGFFKYDFPCFLWWFHLGINVQIPQCDFLKQSSSIEFVQLDTQFVLMPVVLEDGRQWMVRNKIYIEGEVIKCFVKKVLHVFEFANAFSFINLERSKIVHFLVNILTLQEVIFFDEQCTSLLVCTYRMFIILNDLTFSIINKSNTQQYWLVRDQIARQVPQVLRDLIMWLNKFISRWTFSTIIIA